MAEGRSCITNRQRQRDIYNACRVEMDRQLRGECEKGSVLARVAEMLGISKRTVQRYWNIPPEEFNTPNKKRRNATAGNVDDFGKEVIRRIIYRLYSEGAVVTLDTVLTHVRQAEEAGFNGGRTSLYKILLNMGFKWDRTNGRRALLDEPRISEWRTHFLRAYRRYKEEGFVFIFMDETWFYSKGFPAKTLQDGSLSTMKRKSIDKGKRYMVVHAGSSNGFVEGAHLVFSSKVMDGDYHKSFNGTVFESWLTEQLLPSLEEPSVIVVDNAPYHSTQADKRPTKSWSKKLLLEWLEHHQVPASSQMTHERLLHLAHEHMPSKVYRVDQLIQRAGHQVLRLPPYHCHYNPIEMAWSDCKRYYRQHAGRGQRFDEQSVLAIWDEAVRQVTPEKWANYVRHCDTIMSNDGSRDALLSERITVLPVVAQLDDSSTEDDPSDVDDPAPTPTASPHSEVLAVPLQSSP